MSVYLVQCKFNKIKTWRHGLSAQFSFISRQESISIYIFSLSMLHLIWMLSQYFIFHFQSYGLIKDCARHSIFDVKSDRQVEFPIQYSIFNLHYIEYRFIILSLIFILAARLNDKLNCIWLYNWRWKIEYSIENSILNFQFGLKQGGRVEMQFWNQVFF